MRFLFAVPYAIVCILLLSTSALCSEVKPRPLSDTEIRQLTAQERAHEAETVTAGDFSALDEKEARHAYAIMVFGAVLVTVGICGASAALIRAAIRRRAYGHAAERRNNTRYAVPAERAVVTLQTPYGEIKADPVDISSGGIQLVVTDEQPTRSARSRNSDKIRLTLSAAGAGGARILDSIPCMICWARKDRLGLRFDANINMETLFALQMTGTSAA